MQNSFARKPAVEPVLGVSIEEYKEVAPEKAKGFDFNRKPTSKTNQKEESLTTKANFTERTHSQADLRTDTATDTSHSGTLVLLFFIFLPIIASGIVFYKLAKTEEKQERPTLRVINGSKEDETENDDDDIKRAS